MLGHSASDLRLMRRAIPFVAVAVVLRLATDLLGWDTVELNTLHSGLVAASVFLIGFLLAGTLADYKESEKLPGELAGRMETIVDECQILFLEKAAEPARRCIEHIDELSRELGEWLGGREPVEAVLDRIEGLNRYFLEFQPLTQPNFIVRLKQEQSSLRLLVIRINTIRETSFVGAGYVIAEITSLLLIVALMFTDIAPLGIELLLVGTIAFLLSYMIMLIRDLDDPFEYDGRQRVGSAEVSLAPLGHLRRRLERELTG
jgi:hypothetical protein